MMTTKVEDISNDEFIEYMNAYFRWREYYFVGNYESVKSRYKFIIIIRFKPISEEDYIENISKHPTIHIDDDVSVKINGGNHNISRLVKLDGNRIVRLNEVETSFFRSMTYNDKMVWSDLKTSITTN
jgi:hypothetical protein